MAHRNPLTRITDLAADALANPRSTAEKAVGQVKETSTNARAFAVRIAARASDTASTVAHRARPSRHRGAEPTSVPHLTPAQPAPESRKVAGDPLAPASKASAPKAPATKPAAKQSPATKPAAKKSAATTPQSGPESERTSHHEPTPADVAPNIAPHPPAGEAPSTPGDKLPPRKRTSSAKSGVTGQA